MDLLNRHRNLIVLVLVLFAQIIGLAVQVKRPTDGGSVALIRLWGIGLFTPAEKAVVYTQDWIHHTWRNYFYLRDVRRENERLREENTRLRLDQVRMVQDASQAQRLQALLKFKEQFISQTVAAQVIGSSGSEQSRVIYIDKGSNDGLKADMAVITPEGIIGKIIRALPLTAQVLEINDQSSGVGAILEKSRLQGILKGTATGGTLVNYIMADEKVEPGEMVLTSGGDRIFPKGLPIGQVIQVSPGSDSFLNIQVKPSARLDRLEEVLVITHIVEKERDMVPEVPMRASDILAQRLPTVPPKPPAPAAGAPAPGSAGTAAPAEASAKPVAAQRPATEPSTGKPPERKPPAVAVTGAAAITKKPEGASASASGAMKPTTPPKKPVSQATGPGQAKAPETGARKPASVPNRATATRAATPAQAPASPLKDKSE